MPKSEDYYEVLGVPKDAAQDEIKAAYRKSALKYHPDRNPGDKAAEEKLKRASEAYSVLGDPDKRARYDRFGTAAEIGRGGIPWDSDVFMDFSDLLGGLFGFGDFFGGGGGRRARPQRGADLRYDLRLTFEEAFFGKEQALEIPKEETCPDCRGSGSRTGQRITCTACRGSGSVAFRQGFFTVSRTCPQCRGEGEIVRDPCGGCGGKGRKAAQKTLKVKIPPGVDSGVRLRIAGEGEPGERMGPPGDLYVFLTVEEHAFFKREEDDLVCAVPVSPAQAALGTTVVITTLEGEEKVDIPPGTQAGARFKADGKGMPRMGRRGRGDLIVVAVLQTPKRLSKEEKRLYQELLRLEREREEKGEGFFRKILGKIAEGI